MQRYLLAAALVVLGSAAFWAQGAKKAYVLVQVVAFPSFERAQEFYKSAEYEAARKVRAGAATAQFVLVEGI